MEIQALRLKMEGQDESIGQLKFQLEVRDDNRFDSVNHGGGFWEMDR